jgi:hypothetical protein
MLRTDIRGSGVPFIVLVGDCGYGPSRNHRLNASTRQFDFGFLGRTCVCFQSRLTDDRGTHSETKGPLQYVNSAKVGEEKQGCRNPGNGKVLDPSKTHTSRSHGQAFILRRTYFSRTAGQTITSTLSPMGMRVSE